MEQLDMFEPVPEYDKIVNILNGNNSFSRPILGKNWNKASRPILKHINLNTFKIQPFAENRKLYFKIDATFKSPIPSFKK